MMQITLQVYVFVFFGSLLLLAAAIRADRWHDPQDISPGACLKWWAGRRRRGGA